MAKNPTQTTDSPYASLEKPYQFFRGLRHMYLDSRRREKPDPVPIQPPVGYKKQPSLHEQIRDMIKSEQLARDLAAQGIETFDEADDFDIPDDPIDPSTPYEADFEGDAGGAVIQALQDEHAARAPQAPANPPPTGPQPPASVQEWLQANPHFDPRHPPSANSPGAGPFPADQAGPARTSNSPGGDPPPYPERQRGRASEAFSRLLSEGVGGLRGEGDQGAPSPLSGPTTSELT